jgi:hypothetical protein
LTFRQTSTRKEERNTEEPKVHECSWSINTRALPSHKYSIDIYFLTMVDLRKGHHHKSLIMWLNCDKKSSFFILEFFLISEAASLTLDCCVLTKLPYNQYVSYSFDCIKLNDILVSSTYCNRTDQIIRT